MVAFIGFFTDASRRGKKRSGQRRLYPAKVISGNKKSSSARTHNAEARAEAGGVSAVSFPVE